MNEHSDSEHTAPSPKTLLQHLRSGWRMLLGKHPDNSLKEAIAEVLEEHEEEVEELPEEEQKILKKVLNFGVLTVSDIMVPRSDIKAVEYNLSLEELKWNLTQHFHTRMPVYNDTLDNVKGFVHIKDMLPFFSGEREFNMALVLREILFVPPSMKLTNLLVEMRQAGVHMAIVVDEYGGTDGLVTLEDVFEEIVGDIQDEHDDDEEDAFGWNEHGYVDVSAQAPVNKLEKDLHLSLKEKDADYDTLGGLIFHTLKHVPVAGESIDYAHGVRFEILAADPRLIKKVRIFKP